MPVGLPSGSGALTRSVVSACGRKSARFAMSDVRFAATLRSLAMAAARLGRVVADGRLRVPRHQRFFTGIDAGVSAGLVAADLDRGGRFVEPVLGERFALLVVIDLRATGK